MFNHYWEMRRERTRLVLQRQSTERNTRATSTSSRFVRGKTGEEARNLPPPKEVRCAAVPPAHLPTCTDATTVEAVRRGSTTCPYRKGFVVSLFLALTIASSVLKITVVVVHPAPYLRPGRTTSTTGHTDDQVRLRAPPLKLMNLVRGSTGGGSLPLSPRAPQTPLVFRKDLA